MIYDTDTIKYYSATRDSVFGSITEGSAVEYNCVIEDTNEIVTNKDGQQVKANSLILIDSTFPGVEGDFIELYKQFGTATGNTTKYEIMQVFETGGFSKSHKEVMI